MPPAICKGCQASLKRSGLYPHLRKSQNPDCKRYLRQLSQTGIPKTSLSDSSNEGFTEHRLDSNHFEQATATSNDQTPVSQDGKINPPDLFISCDDLQVDPTGDFFGDYADYGPEEWGMDVDYQDVPGGSAHSDNKHQEEATGDHEEVELDIALDADLAEEESGLEPERFARMVTDTQADQPEYFPATRLRGGAEEPLQKRPVIVKFRKPAGAVYDTGLGNTNQQYTTGVSNASNPYAPFQSELEWQVARWAKLRGPSSTAFTELMSISGVVEKLGLSFKNTRELNKIIDSSLPGRPPFKHSEVVVGSEVCEIFSRDILECVRCLYGDTDFAPYLVLVPEKHYTDDSKTVRMYHDTKTGRWWWSTQEAIEKEKPGATIIPILISTDKTQLTEFRNKSAYPLYLTIGNIPKEIRRKPSARAYILLAYLPTTHLEHVTNKAQRRRLLANLYHACLGKILKPLEAAGVNGLFMTSGDGLTRRGHPIFAGFIGDYPEQVLATGVKTGECPGCDEDRDDIGELNPNPKFRDLDAILKALDSFDSDPANFLRNCKKAGIKPIIDPFWKNLPYANIHRSITPDILHQLYQGIVKHLVAWLIAAYGAEEIDARCRRMPPNHNVRTFTKGISTLSRVSGMEHDQMCRILLGLVIDIPLENGSSPNRVIRCVRALLDFLYLAQYPVHTDTTLELLEDALTRFHEDKEIFEELGIREGWNIPKLHFASHYVDLIKLLGTTDNFNTEYTERLHIDLAKDAYEATNRKDEFSQMTTWLERKEKVLRHQQYVEWRLQGSPQPTPQEWLPPGLELDRKLVMAKHPSVHAVPISVVESHYGAQYFRWALRRFIAARLFPNLNRTTLEQKLDTIRIPFQKIGVWHKIRYQRTDQFTQVASTADAIHSRPARRDARGRPVPGRFDTVLVNDGTGKLTGVAGYRIARVRVVFSFPDKAIRSLFPHEAEFPQHLAYVEWYSAFPDEPDPIHELYQIKQLKDAQGGRICSIIPLVNIRRSVHLFPTFGAFAPPEWTASTVLDACDSFFVNCFTDRHLYRIIQ